MEMLILKSIIAQREAHKLEHSRSSNDLNIPPYANGKAHRSEENDPTLGSSFIKKGRPAGQKLRRRSTLDWTNALPEVRHKKLENVASERLADTWFSMHCQGIEEPLYVSEVVDRAMNPSFRSFDINTYGPWVTRRDELVIKLWARTADSANYRLLIDLQVHLRSLQFVGKSVCGVINL